MKKFYRLLLWVAFCIVAAGLPMWRYMLCWALAVVLVLTYNPEDTSA